MTVMILLQTILAARDFPLPCGHTGIDLPSVVELSLERPQADEDRIIEYLCQGVECAIMNEARLIRDLIQPAKRISKQECSRFCTPTEEIWPNMLYTDGVWAWFGAFVYYVATYHISVRAAFTNHARAQEWKISKNTVDLRKVDGTFC